MPGYYVRIYVDNFQLDYSNGFNHGHAFIELGRPDGHSDTVGFYPDTTDPSRTGSSWPSTILEAKGVVFDDSGHPFDWSSEKIEVSEEQYERMAEYIQWTVEHPGQWGVAWNNCAGFVHDVLDIGGLRPASRLHPAPRAGVFEGLGLPDNPFGFDLDIAPYTNESFTSAARYTAPRHDPLTLDLDGDGLETTGLSPTAPIYFDHTGSGIRTATGWLRPDDAFLVLDRNGNGLIDSGRELFGDSTIKRDGQRAADGFDALRDLDSNADGKISALDARFAELRLWRDLNQDGVSQSNELFTLGQLNVASINVGASAHRQTLANGNQIADLGTYTRSDGSLGTTGEVTGNLADINLVGDPFHRQFTDTLDTTAVAGLPDLRGSGAVRDLRQAATLSPALAATLAVLAPSTPREALQTAVVQVIEQWADSAAFSDSFETGARLTAASLTGFADPMDFSSATSRRGQPWSDPVYAV